MDGNVDIDIIGGFFVDERCPFLHCFLGIKDRWELIIFYLDQLQGLEGCFLVRGSHSGNLFPKISDLVGR